MMYFGTVIQPSIAMHLVMQTLCVALALHPARHACAMPVSGVSRGSSAGIEDVVCQYLFRLPWLQLLDNASMEASIRSFHSVMAVPLLHILPAGWPEGGRHRQCVAAMDFLSIFLGWLVPTYFVVRSQCHTTADAGSSRQEQAEGQPARRPTAAAWALENVFLDGAPPMLQLIAWCILAAMCWLIASVLPVP